MQTNGPSPFAAGLAALHNPVLPLVRLVQLLYLTGPFTVIDEVLCQLTEPIDTGTVVYDSPDALLAPYLPVLKEFERLKIAAPWPRRILNENHAEVDLFEAVESWVSQEVLTRELEKINSLLCWSCQCTLCCTGPDNSMRQLFFEIPLSSDEADLFQLQRIDSPESRRHTAQCDPVLLRDGRPFYETSPALYNWRTGLSLILPRYTSCPHLEPEKAYCQIYPQRPEVCRRPQIFAYVLERQPELDRQVDGHILPAFINRRKLLAVWDCPYVKEFQEEIAEYAALCGVEIIFKQNKA